ncbi:MAG TPA: PfkB family carbohydrate kinase [Anaerolineae bacterium]
MRYLAIGHICQDVLPSGRALGGTVTYSTLTARALGWTALAVTRAHPRLDLSLLRDVECICIPDEVTTTFENIYREPGRVQVLRAAAGPIRRGDIPPEFRNADVIHLAPVAREIDPELAQAFTGTFIGVTPQGWLRRWDASGHVSPRDWSEAGAILPHADAIVLSIDDVGGDWARIERWAEIARVLVVTQAREGCTVYTRGRSMRVPAPAVVEVDPTGAGDIFAAAFFAHLRTTGDPLDAARFANCIAAHSVTRRGVEGVPTIREVKDCEGDQHSAGAGHLTPI